MMDKIKYMIGKAMEPLYHKKEYECKKCGFFLACPTCSEKFSEMDADLESKMRDQHDNLYGTE